MTAPYSDSFTMYEAKNWGISSVLVRINYSYEILMQSACMLGTDDETHEYDYLGAWGPRFNKLADLYGPDLDEQL